MADVSSIRAKVIDELGKLAEQLEPARPLLKRYDEIRKQIAGWFDGEPADQTFVEAGKAYEVEISERAEERTINIAKLAKKLGPKRFLTVVKVPMSALDQHVSPEDQRDMVTTERTGGRRVKVRRKGGKEAA